MARVCSIVIQREWNEEDRPTEPSSIIRVQAQANRGTKKGKRSVTDYLEIALVGLWKQRHLD